MTTRTQRRDEGGRVALTGYLYQIVGVLSLPVRVRGFRSGDAILSVAADQAVQSELFEDAAIRGTGIRSTDSMVLIQFKHSRLSSREVGPRELKTIADGFAGSAEAATIAGNSVTAFVFLSNRRLDADAENMRTLARTGGAHSKITATNRHVLANLHVPSPVDFETWYQRLHSFAHRFGATDDEIDRATDALIGRMLRQTVEAEGVVRPADLVHAFAGSTEARELTPESVAEVALHNFTADWRVPQAQTLCDRSIVSEIATLAETRALVIVEGDGGCGKTAALWLWAHGLLGSKGSGAFTAVKPAPELPKDLVRATIARWANIDDDLFQRRTTTADLALTRLRIANPGDRLLVHLGLDGADDVVEANRLDWLRDLLRWFWRHDQEARRMARTPSATLVVTCRKFKSAWLRHDTSGYDKIEELAEVTRRVGEFTPGELGNAVRTSGLPVELSDRIAAALAGSSGAGSMPEAYATFGSGPPPTAPIAHTDVLTALLHPAMWEAFLRVADHRKQTRLLDGGPDATPDLAANFLERFVGKAEAREQHVDMERDRILEALCIIARGTDWNRADLSRQDWINAARPSGLSEVGAAKLHDEALSGGLVRPHGPTWGWRHPFVWRYLRGGPDQAAA